MQTFNSRARKAILALAAVSLVVLGSVTLVGSTASAAKAPPAPAQPPRLDHFLCFTATDPSTPPAFVPPGAIELKNQFWMKGKSVVVGTVDMHCNPTEKVVQSVAGGPTQTFPSKSPDYHLLCLSIVAPNSPPENVLVTDQFGTFYLTATTPRDLCLPSLKTLTAPPIPWPPKASTVPPTEIAPDHFACFNVVPSTLGRTVPTIPAVTAVGDEFIHALDGPSATLPVQVNPVPDLLCLPTQKTVSITVTTNGRTKVEKTVYKITDKTAHLLCFPVTETPFISPVFDSNQFNLKGAPVVIAPPSTQYPESLCLPSYKKLLK